MTPDAKPSRSFSKFLFMLPFIKNTIADPKAVPQKGMLIPNQTILTSTRRAAMADRTNGTNRVTMTAYILTFPFILIYAFCQIVSLDIFTLACF